MHFWGSCEIKRLLFDTVLIQIHKLIHTTLPIVSMATLHQMSSCIVSLHSIMPRSRRAFLFCSSSCCRDNCSSRCISRIYSIGTFSSVDVPSFSRSCKIPREQWKNTSYPNTSPPTPTHPNTTSPPTPAYQHPPTNTYPPQHQPTNTSPPTLAHQHPPVHQHPPTITSTPTHQHMLQVNCIALSRNLLI